MRAGRLIVFIVGIFLILLLPATGALLAGRDVDKYLSFPPAAPFVVHMPLSWTVFVILAGLIILILVHPVCHIIRERPLPSDRMPSVPMPTWGRAGMILCAVVWIIAWTRIPVLSSVQRYTFFPLWLSYILVVNGLCLRRTGTSLLTRRPRYLASLFPVSVLFWWCFEYLNRFTNNWYYLGTGELSPLRYFSEATLAFSTVLPAVMSTAELLKSHPAFYAGMDRYVVVGNPRPRLAAFIAFMAGCLGLVLTPVYPEWLFPLLWIAPFVILAALNVMTGRRTFLSGIRSGDWRALAVYPLAALACGFFWEMWNMGSMARWIYSIPYVHVFKIFEMPLLGYAGYLPFGLECALVAGMVSGEGDEPWGEWP